jgi:hypothetical protein
MKTKGMAVFPVNPDPEATRDKLFFGNELQKKPKNLYFFH